MGSIVDRGGEQKQWFGCMSVAVCWEAKHQYRSPVPRDFAFRALGRCVLLHPPAKLTLHLYSKPTARAAWAWPYAYPLITRQQGPEALFLPPKVTEMVRLLEEIRERAVA